MLGLSKAIIKKGGHQISEDCRRYIQQNKQLPIGQAMATTAGALGFSHIIHTAAPQYPGDNSQNSLLELAIYSTLELCEKLGATSIAMPIIGAGVFGFPPETSVKVIIYNLFIYDIIDFCVSVV